jgi:hypothetical protein
VTIDSLHFTSAQNLDFTVFVDLVAHNPSGELTALVPEPGGLAMLATALAGCLPTAARRLRSRRPRTFTSIQR